MLFNAPGGPRKAAGVQRRPQWFTSRPAPSDRMSGPGAGPAVLAGDSPRPPKAANFQEIFGLFKSPPERDDMSLEADIIGVSRYCKQACML